MRAFIFIAFIALASMVMAGESKKEGGKPDFYAYNADGSVKIRGIYETDAKGRVTKYTAYDGTGKLLFTEIPYYAGDGRIIRGDHFDAHSKLEKVVVFFDAFAKVLDREGKVIGTQGFSQGEFLQSAK